MNLTLSDVLTSIVTVTIVATGLVFHELPSANHHQAPAHDNVRHMSPKDVSGDTTNGSVDLCRRWSDNKHERVSPGGSSSNTSITETMNGLSHEFVSAPAYVYVTIIQSNGIPVPGVYSAQASDHGNALLRPSNVFDVFSMC